MRALFIIHCQDPIYGAGRSVSALIRSLDSDIDIIFPFKVRRKGRITPEQIKRYFGEHVKNVWYLPQPSRLTVWVDKLPYIDYFKSIIKEFLFFITKFQYKKIYNKGKYDFIHLNSVTLYPMLDEKYPMFLHVREIVREKLLFCDKFFWCYAQKARGIFFIDQRSQEVFPSCDVSQIILTNPFDQTKVKQVDLYEAQEKYSISNKVTVYSIIGNIIQGKGVLFVINAFKKAMLTNAVLLIVGQDLEHNDYERKVYKAATDNSQIRMLGEVEDMDPIYRITDYVVRGDDVVRWGRTIWEGLYSGCGAILQSQTADDQIIYDITAEMQKKIEFYKLQDENSLINAFRKTQNKKMMDRQYYSNTLDYTQKFLSFIEDNI